MYRLIPLLLLVACGKDKSEDSLVTPTGHPTGTPTAGTTSTTDICDGVDCSGHGRCNGSSGAPVCECNGNYIGDQCELCDPDHACGSSCCQSGSECLFGSCVQPTLICSTDDDCAAGQYCEDGLTGPVGTGTCPTGSPGRCVTAPAACTTTAFPDRCADTCERTLAADAIETQAAWHWGYGGAAATEFATQVDVWNEPAVGRVVDADCDGQITDRDPPNVVFVSADMLEGGCGDAGNNYPCSKGVLRVLDGATGAEVWSLDVAEAGSIGFAGVGVAIGDVTGDGMPNIVALTGEGKIAVLDGEGTVVSLSTDLVEGVANAAFGSGGAISLGDMDQDGSAEIAVGRQVFSMLPGAPARVFTGSGGEGGVNNRSVQSHFVQLDGTGGLELLAGNTAYQAGGAVLWTYNGLPDGFSAAAELNGLAGPEVVLVANGQVTILEGATGQQMVPPLALTGGGDGGPPAIADFDGDGDLEIAVSSNARITMLQPSFRTGVLREVWSASTHDEGSSLGGVSAFDFEGDGKVEVLLDDECFFWVFDGADGTLLHAEPTQTISYNDAPVVADVDGDGRANVVLAHNGADQRTWICAHHTTGTDGFPIWDYFNGTDERRGITVLESTDGSWANARPLKNQIAYSITNICSDDVGTCATGEGYGAIPRVQADPWADTWSSGYKLSALPDGVVDGADAAIWLWSSCDDPPLLKVHVRNEGSANLPVGIPVELYDETATLLDTVTTTRVIEPGNHEVLEVQLSGGQLPGATYEARLGTVDGPGGMLCDDTDDVATAQAICP